MKKVTMLVLMLCFILSGALCYAHGEAGTGNEKGKGIPIEVKQRIIHGGTDKSDAIMPSIDGHTLLVVFTENLGQVQVTLTTASGGPVDLLSMTTPNGYIYYIADTGDYIITFTLSNGDVYYGEFTVTD